MIVAVGQFNATTDKAANTTAATDLIERAARQGAALVVLPENSMWSDPDVDADTEKAAESIDGPFASSIARQAEASGITVVAGMTESRGTAGSRPSNTVFVVGPDGRLRGAYRKVHLYDAFGYRESDRIEAHAPEAVTFTLDGITFGVMTCYDVRFPEMARFLVDAGAQALIVPAAWAVGPSKEDHWTTLTRARAIENTVYVLASGQTAPTCTGRSAVIDPMGHLVATAAEAPGVVCAVLNPERVEQVRAKNPSLANRKFSVTYGRGTPVAD